MPMYIARIRQGIEPDRSYQLHSSFFHLECFSSQNARLSQRNQKFSFVSTYVFCQGSTSASTPHDADANPKLLKVCHFLLHHQAIGRFLIRCVHAVNQRYRFEMRILVPCDFQHVQLEYHVFARAEKLYVLNRPCNYLVCS